MSSVQGPRSTRAGDRWRVVWREPGSRKQQVVGGFTSREAAEAWRTLLDHVGGERARAALGEPVSDVPVRTVADQVEHHIAHLTGVTDGTRKRYRGYLERRIVGDPLGKIPLPMARRDDFAAWVQRLEAVPLSRKTIMNHHSLVSDAMRSAVREGLVAVNFAEGIRIATPDVDDSDEMVTLSYAELWRFVQATPEHWRPMVLWMFGTGCRWQETAALQVGDVDLDGGTARIVRAWKDTAGAGHQLGKTKSKRSRRTIVFGREVGAALAPLLDGRAPGAFVFTNTRGGPVRRSNFHDEAWGKALHTFAGDRLELAQGARGRPRKVWHHGPGPRPTPHDARHTYASLQIQRGASDAFLQRQLGHESITTTINTYTHLRTEDLRSLANIIDQPLPLIEGISA